jgi:uncharacterized membrane protein
MSFKVKSICMIVTGFFCLSWSFLLAGWIIGAGFIDPTLVSYATVFFGLVVSIMAFGHGIEPELDI